MTKKKTIPVAKVIIDNILSTPLSLVLEKMFMVLPPVIAEEAPSDFPDCIKQMIIRNIETMNKTISAADI